MKNNKVYPKRKWSWFYKKFIHKTVNDNFYTAAEVIEENREIIERVKGVVVNKKEGGPAGGSN